MPLFDYVCEEHGTFEVLRKYEDSEKEFCPECEKECKKIIGKIAAMKGNWSLWSKNIPAFAHPRHRKTDAGPKEK